MISPGRDRSGARRASGGSGGPSGSGGSGGSGGPGGGGGDPRDPAGRGPGSSDGDPGQGPGGPSGPGGGRIGPTGHRTLVVLLLVGLVGGWALRPLALRAGVVEPRIGWGTIGLVLFLAAAVGVTAWTTRRTVRRDRAALGHHQAVNRLALGQACSLVGAVLLGGYAGYGMAQLGLSDPSAQSRLLHAGAAAVGSALLLGAALWLQHACRVPGDDS
ncbi:MAG: hypothetical protein JWR20_2379 [Marmoricola sp.]|nr:hypothetical protein [Marmoricola sp.]